MQYGAWLRGEPSRRGGYEISKPVMRASPNGNVDSGDETRQAVITAQVPEVQMEIRRAYVEKLIEQGANPSASGEPKLGLAIQAESVLHENGKECESMEKKHEKVAQFSESASASSTDHDDQPAYMHWEKAPFLEKEPTFKFVMAPNVEMGNDVESPRDKEAIMGPMALNYDTKDGWVAAKLGPKSKHWKRLAREVNNNKPAGKKGLKNGKREGPTPVQELDSNSLKQKHRKGLKHSDIIDEVGITENKNESMDGEVAVSAEQHRPAS